MNVVVLGGLTSKTSKTDAASSRPLPCVASSAPLPSHAWLPRWAVLASLVRSTLARQAVGCGWNTRALPGAACGPLLASRRAPVRRCKTVSCAALRPAPSACSPVVCANSAASACLLGFSARLVVVSQSKQVNARVVVIFTQPKSGHMFARRQNIISASPVFMRLIQFGSSLRSIIEHIARSYLARFRQAVGTKRGVDAR